MREKKQHFTARISESLIKRINEEAKKRGTTVTAIVEEAFRIYFNEPLDNLVDATTLQTQITELTKIINDLERRMAAFEIIKGLDSEKNPNSPKRE